MDIGCTVTYKSCVFFGLLSVFSVLGPLSKELHACLQKYKTSQSIVSMMENGRWLNEMSVRNVSTQNLSCW